MSAHAETFREFLLRERKNHNISKDLIFLLEDIATSCRIISHQIRGGAFSGRLVAADSENIQGETQKKLDVIANDIFVRHLSNCGRVAALVSEEVEEVYWLKEQPEAGDYLVYFDPLDGSSNLDVNLSVGSIFSVVELSKTIDSNSDASVLISGNDQVCAGYALYGPSTSLVLTTGEEVNGFTHQLGTGEFRLTFPEMRIPAQTSEFAVNASRYSKWDEPVRRYFDECIKGKSGPRLKTFNMRWTASMVAEVHRILTRGGIFMYPQDKDNRKAGGKLRLMYEANPMAFIAEQAGGAASTGYERILDIAPVSHHQRVPVILGSSEEVGILDRYHSNS